ncbi:MAG: MgtC/SapB family protein [Sphingomonadales bacterium]|nr:MgtC/SapB family protein [Sphingomonadales bacterium]
MESLGDIKTFENLAAALALGFVVGLERGWSFRERGEGTRFAGLRTFMLIALLGGLTVILSNALGELVLIIGFGALALVLAAVVLRAGAAAGGDHGITTVIAALITYSLGMLSGLGLYTIAASAAVVTAVILGLKPVLHSWLQGIERNELAAALKFLVISAVVLPILPDQGYGPWAALNPYQIWWMVVLISGISFIGYFAIKWTAPGKGIMLTALVGGLASSTAITISFSRLGSKSEGLRRMLSAGIVASSTMMLLRMLVVAAAIEPMLAQKLLPMLAVAAATGGVAAWRIWPAGEKGAVNLSELSATSFDLDVPLRFGALLAIVLLVSAAARAYLGDSGLYLVAALAGLTDVDAMTLTVARNISLGLPLSLAAGVALTAAVANTLVKAAIVAATGGKDMAVPVAAAFVAMIAAIIAALLIF